MTAESPVSVLVDRKSVEDVWEREWEAMILEECLRRVRTEVHSSTYRAFEGIVIEGRDPEDVAASLEMSRGAAYVAKHRVLKRIEHLVHGLKRLDAFHLEM